MGGLNETRISGLRLHVNEMVHVHDDARSLKFEAALSDFKEQVEAGLEELSDDDGVYPIKGLGKNTLLLIKDGKDLSMVLSEQGSVRKELNAFLKKI